MSRATPKNPTKTAKKPRNAATVVPKKKPKVKETASRINGLLPKQAKFVAEYLISGNATQAAIHAG